MPHPVPIYKNDFVEDSGNLPPMRALPPGENNDLFRQPIAFAISTSKRPFLNWNGSNRTSEIPAIFPMPRRYTGIRSKSPFAMSHDRRRGFFVPASFVLESPGALRLPDAGACAVP
jgi:hypothetical protein